MSYNVENYPNSRSGVSITSIEPYYKMIINEIQPDAIVAVEVVQQSGVNQFLTNVLGSDYKAANVTISSTNSLGNDGNDCSFYYKPGVLTLVDYKAIPARTRVISKFTLIHNNSPKDTLIIFGVHLKANDYSSDNVLNAQKRTDAINSLRDETKQYPVNKNYIICGDFNIFSSNESAFQKMLDKSLPGYFIDPLNAIGDWSGNSAFNNACSYSAKVLDTRLDMMLISPGVKTVGGVDYKEGSYKIFGNDGKHFGVAVNNGTNDWFSENPFVGTALINASDHLPVFADFTFGVSTDVSQGKDIPSSIELKQNYPNPFNPETNISYQLSYAGRVNLTVYDMLGRTVSTLINEYKQPGFYNYKFSLNNLPAGGDASLFSSGVYFYQLKVGNFVQTKKMVFLK